MLIRRWHYTTGAKILSIMSDGVIKPATAGLKAGERPAVWFSSNENWEETANKLWGDDLGNVRALNREETAEYADGLFRIEAGSDLPLHDWQAFKRLSGIKPKIAQRIYKSGISVGARPGQWFVSFDPVPISKCQGIETWNSGEWIDATVAIEALKANRSPT